MLDQIVSLLIVSRPYDGGTGQTDGFKTEPMKQSRAERSKGFDVLVGAVSLVARQPEAREDLIPLGHAMVAAGFCKDGGGGDALHLRVTMDDCVARNP